MSPTPASKVFFSDSVTGVTSQFDNGIYPSDFVLGSTGLLYFVVSQEGCGSGGASYCGDALVAMNLATGTPAWQINLDSSYYGGWSGEAYGLPVAATSDGGLMTISYPLSSQTNQGAARIDVSGNITVDSDLSPYNTTFPSFQSSLSYLGGPEGTMWASTSSGTVISDFADLQPQSGPVSDFRTPTGDGSGHRAAKCCEWMDADTNKITITNPNTGASTQEDEGCGGFDDKSPAILVVPVGGTNTVQLQIKGKWQGITLQSDTKSVTINPSAATGSKKTYTITGGPTPVLARIKAINTDGSNLATLRVAVKQRVDTALGGGSPGFYLDLYSVKEANENKSPTNVPTDSQVQAALDKTWGVQANVHFTVTTKAPKNSPISVAYDLNGDGRLQSPLEQGATKDEINTIISYVINSQNCPTILANCHRFVAYVHDIQPEVTLGFNGGGNSIFIQDVTHNGQDVKTAHEMGHVLDIGYNVKDHPEQLMNENDTGAKPCRIKAEEWHIVNPTGNSLGPKEQWELASPQPQDQ